MATRSVTSVAPGKAAARSALPFSQRSTSWTAWVITILGTWSPPIGIAIADSGANLPRAWPLIRGARTDLGRSAFWAVDACLSARRCPAARPAQSATARMGQGLARMADGDYAG